MRNYKEDRITLGDVLLALVWIVSVTIMIMSGGRV